MDNNNEANALAYDTHPVDMRALITMLGVGAVVGAVGWLLYLAMSQFFVEPVFCRSVDAFTACRNGGTIAWVGAHIIALAAAVAVLARLSVYRPLLVVLAVLISLWGAHSWLGAVAWYAGLLWQVVLFALAFAAFGWIARTTNFVVAVVASLAVAVLARLILLWA